MLLALSRGVMLVEVPPPEPPPRLRVPEWDLPAYRFVPGMSPHPFRHPDGHMYSDGSAPKAPHWVPDLPWETDRLWLRGLDLFDQRYFWECHEAFEGIWHQAEPGSGVHILCQGLIQSSAFVLKVHMGHERAAKVLLSAAQSKLKMAHDLAEDAFRGVRISTLSQRLSSFQEGGDWPVIEA
jgi:uncharacterized protein